MINLKATKKTPTITVGVNPVTTIHVADPHTTSTTTTTQTNIERGGAIATVATSPVTVSTQALNGQGPVSTSNDMSAQAPNGQRPMTESEKVERIAELTRENEVLKLIIDILHSNPLIVNKYVIADDELLIQMIALLCNASDVQIDAEDVGTGCISKNKYRKVQSIYVTAGDKTLNLKYDYPSVMKALKDLHISTKYVF